MKKSLKVAPWLGKDDKYCPGNGCFNRTATELIEALDKNPDDIRAVIGDWIEEAGAWIQFNPLDGIGVKATNVTAFRYALIESDTLPLEEQERIL